MTDPLLHGHTQEEATFLAFYGLGIAAGLSARVDPLSRRVLAELADLCAAQADALARHTAPDTRRTADRFVAAVDVLSGLAAEHDPASLELRLSD